MKKYIRLVVAGFVFLTVTAFSLIIRRKSIGKDQINKVQQRRIALGCSPAYVPKPDESIPRLTGWGNYQWKITTKSDSAQFYFNQGINMYYGFHIIEALASFKKASRFDPQTAMTWWAQALAYGPNINDVGYSASPEALEANEKASSLSGGSSALEKDLIQAMLVRYTADTT